MTFYACVRNRKITDQNTVKGLSGLKMKAIVEYSTIENLCVRLYLLTYYIFEFLLNILLIYLSDWGKTTCDLISLVGTCTHWD